MIINNIPPDRSIYKPTAEDLAKWPCRRGPGCANHEADTFGEDPYDEQDYDDVEDYTRPEVRDPSLGPR
jgi:hypothetical protein